MPLLFAFWSDALVEEDARPCPLPTEDPGWSCGAVLWRQRGHDQQATCRLPGVGGCRSLVLEERGDHG